MFGEHKYAIAPKWLQEAEVFNGWYPAWSDEVIRERLPGFPVIVRGGDREHDTDWIRKAHAEGIRVILYLSYHTWRWKFEPDEDKRDALTEGEIQRIKESEKKIGDIRELEDWALVSHPEWILYDEDGNAPSPFEPSYQGGTIREPCMNTPGVVEACLELTKALMDGGADGIFVDNVHPSPECYGPRFGKHEHIEPDRSNLEMYKVLLGKVRELVKSYGEDKIVMLNSGDADLQFAPYGDCLMWESYICSHAWNNHRPDWEGVRHIAEEFGDYVRGGGTVGALSYVGHTTYGAKEDAFWSYVCARLSGFLWADWFTSKDTDGWGLYRVRLGRPMGEMREIQGVWYRLFEHGCVALNPEGEGSPPEQLAMIPPRTAALPVGRDRLTFTDCYTGTSIPVQQGKLVLTILPCSARVYSVSYTHLTLPTKA